MTDIAKILISVSRCDDPKALRVQIKNAKDVLARYIYSQVYKQVINGDFAYEVYVGDYLYGEIKPRGDRFAVFNEDESEAAKLFPADAKIVRDSRGTRQIEVDGAPMVEPIFKNDELDKVYLAIVKTVRGYPGRRRCGCSLRRAARPCLTRRTAGRRPRRLEPRQPARRHQMPASARNKVE